MHADAEAQLRGGLAVGHCLFALGCWVILVLVGIALNGTEVLTSGHRGLYLLNCLVFAAVQQHRICGRALRKDEQRGRVWSMSFPSE